MSEAALASFAKFFLQTCIDRVEIMATLIQPDRMQDRIMIWTKEEMRAGNLPAKPDIVLKAVFYQGKLERGEVDGMLGMSERAARRITSTLPKVGALKFDSTRATPYQAFPAKYAHR